MPGETGTASGRQDLPGGMGTQARYMTAEEYYKLTQLLHFERSSLINKDLRFFKSLFWDLLGGYHASQGMHDFGGDAELSVEVPG